MFDAWGDLETALTTIYVIKLNSPIDMYDSHAAIA